MLWLSMVWVELTTDSVQCQNLMQILEFPCLAGCNNQRTMHRHVHGRDSSCMVSHHGMARCRLLQPLRKYFSEHGASAQVAFYLWHRGRSFWIKWKPFNINIISILRPQVPEGDKMACIFGRLHTCLYQRFETCLCQVTTMHVHCISIWQT